MKLNYLWVALFTISGLGMLGNAAFMLASPKAWYHELPAAVPDFGPYNEHFIRDIGCAFAIFGLASLAGAMIKSVRFQVAVLLTAFNGAHSLLHVYDTMRGFVGTDHWLIDLPLVHLPTLLFLAMAIVLWKQREDVA